MSQASATSPKHEVTRYLSTLGAWALAFGCSVGWGSFVMPGTTFLPIAGPIGSVLGISLGGLAMLVLALNFHFLMNRFPDAGGIYTYTKRCFGYDHGFLSAWFLIITYVAIIWANATALPLIARTLLGSAFQFGFSYEVAGFTVYLGEILLAVASLLVAAFVCMNRRFAESLQIVMAVVLLGGIVLCFVASLGNDPGTAGFTPPFAPGNGAPGETFTIFALAPWAYVGFESITHSAAEARFPLKRTFAILAVAVVTAAVAYSLLVLMGATALPEGRNSWVDYVGHLGRYSGVESQPTFFAASRALGPLGESLLGSAALAGIITGLVGHYVALSRLIHAISEDGILPGWIGKLDEDHVPRNAIVCVLAVSLVLPFLGRTAISWIVDVTTVGATIAYAFASAAALKVAREEGRRLVAFTGVLGLVISLLFAVEFLVPNLIAVKTLATESYLILALWGILGFISFRRVIKNDTHRRFGRSIVAWVVLLGLIIFTSSVWTRQTAKNALDDSAERVENFYEDEIRTFQAGDATRDAEVGRAFVEQESELIDQAIFRSVIAQVAMIVAALLALFDIYYRMQVRERQTEIEKALAEESSRAKTSFLSNMSHEIRTPMNAIIGLDNIALRDPDISPRTREHLEKIGTSAKHLLGLINDILDMSRIESGRMVLKDEEFSFHELVDQVSVIIGGQCTDKGLHYECHIVGGVADYYVGDDMKLKQVLINILGNSVKFTDAPGDVTLTVEQLSSVEGVSTLRFAMADTGVGMDADYIPQIFEAFSQEDATTTNRYGGSGLGMAITKNFVEMMGGEIEVESEKGVGSTFTVTVPLRASDRGVRAEEASATEESVSLTEGILEGRRVLMAEDVAQNAEILVDLLELEDIEAEHAVNGQVAVDMFSASPVGYYDAILMDVRMPVLDGLSATRAIRALDRPDARSIPIIAMTANVFDEDVERSFDAGMDAHLSKPVEPERLYETMARLIAEHEEREARG